MIHFLSASYIKILPLILGLFLGVSFYSNATKAEPIEVKVGLIVFPPLVQKELGDKCFGPTVNEVRKIFSAPQYKVKISCASPARVYRDFEQNKIDLTVNIKSTSGLIDNVSYSNRPHVQLKVMLYSNTEINVDSVSSINKFEYHGERDKLQRSGFAFFDNTNIKDSLVVFLRGATGHLIMYKRPFEHYLTKGLTNNAYKGLKIDYSEKILNDAPSFYVINNNAEYSDTLLKEINEYQSRQN